MIIIAMGDGIGNQMFQYAFYYAMKNYYKDSSVLIDCDYLYGSDNIHNGIEINKVFGINIDSCSKTNAFALCDYHKELKKTHPIINTIWWIKMILFGKKESYIEVDDPSVYYEEVFKLNPLKSYYLRGNWINHNYFVSYDEKLKEIFSFPNIDDEQNEKYMNDITASKSVSLHLRACDYLTNKGFEHLDRNYYFNALNYIKSKAGDDIKVFIFSDDKKYAEQFFSHIDNKVIVNCNSKQNSFRDMQLMSLCKYNIIANSTFSFWGAFLNHNKNKIVIAPKVVSAHFRNPFACDDWILI